MSAEEAASALAIRRDRCPQVSEDGSLAQLSPRSSYYYACGIPPAGPAAFVLSGRQVA